MPDVVRALAISTGVLSAVVVLIVIISMVTVKRGEGREGHAGATDKDPTPAVSESVGLASPAAKSATAPVSTKSAGPASAPEEISVIKILLLGTGLFVLTILGLLVLSLIQHLR